MMNLCLSHKTGIMWQDNFQPESDEIFTSLSVTIRSLSSFDLYAATTRFLISTVTDALTEFTLAACVALKPAN